MCGDRRRGSDACVDVNMSKILAILETFFFSRSPILILKIVSRMGDIFDILAPPREVITHRCVPPIYYPRSLASRGHYSSLCAPHLLSIQDPSKIPSLGWSVLLIVVWAPNYYPRSLASSQLPTTCGNEPLQTVTVAVKNSFKIQLGRVHEGGGASTRCQNVKNIGYSGNFFFFGIPDSHFEKSLSKRGDILTF